MGGYKKGMRGREKLNRKGLRQILKQNKNSFKEWCCVVLRTTIFRRLVVGGRLRRANPTQTLCPVPSALCPVGLWQRQPQLSHSFFFLILLLLLS